MYIQQFYCFKLYFTKFTGSWILFVSKGGNFFGEGFASDSRLIGSWRNLDIAFSYWYDYVDNPGCGLRIT